MTIVGVANARRWIGETGKDDANIQCVRRNLNGQIRRYNEAIFYKAIISNVYTHYVTYSCVDRRIMTN